MPLQIEELAIFESIFSIMLLKRRNISKPGLLKIILFSGMFAFVAYSCLSPVKSTISNRYNLSVIYNPVKSLLHPSYKVFHNSNSTSLLYLKIYTSELLFQPIGGQGALKSELSVSFVLYEVEDQGNSVADSGTYNYSVYKNSAGKFYLNQIPIKADTGKSYRLKIVMKDKLKKSSNLSFLEVEKKPGLGEQFFNITNAKGIPLFRNVLTGNEAFKVLHTNPSSDKLYILYYFNNTPLPKPTFAAGSDEFTYGKPDSVFVIHYSPNQAILLLYNGLYFMQFDTTSNEGVSIAKFDDNFPKTTTPEGMLEPLAYITTSAEYNNLLSSENKKLAADNFWIKAGGSTGRGRELIRVYYNRFYFANYYFTNTKPGWKTDRGMVYIVYGPPQSLKKTDNSEIWYYYPKREGEVISFTFDYKPNQYNLNQYILERSEGNTWHWREAVYYWTNGEIFLQD